MAKCAMENQSEIKEQIFGVSNWGECPFRDGQYDMCAFRYVENDLANRRILHDTMKCSFNCPDGHASQNGKLPDKCPLKTYSITIHLVQESEMSKTCELCCYDDPDSVQPCTTSASWEHLDCECYPRSNT